ncbi:MAG: hypothetical protein AAF328_11570 [Planctomycetota bacterium]
MTRRLLLCLSAFIAMHPWFLASASAQAKPNDPGYLWWEAETPVATNVPNGSPFAPGTGGDFTALSAGNWLSGIHKPGQDPFAAAYRLEIPAAGEYTLWARKFWKHGPFEFRFGKQAWQTVDRDNTLIDSATIRKHLGANWVAAGTVTLDAGQTIFAWKQTDLVAGKDEGFALDAFLLTRNDGPHAGFVPAGKNKPGVRDTRHDAGSFAWDPPANAMPEDPDDVGFDLRWLNEAYAGVNGRVTTGPRNGKAAQSFVLPGGKPVRFWGVNVKPDLGDAPDVALNQWARKLAKFGVNLVRVHGPLWTQQAGSWRIDPRKLDNLHRIVAACKKQGIYVKVSWYFPVWVNAEHAGLPGYAGAENENPFAAVFFSPGVQDWYFQSLRDIVTPRNPYTGLSLADDPAVALIELVNEDSLFFWTFKEDNLPAPIWAELETQYKDSTHYVGGELRDIWHLTRKGLENASDTDKKQAQAQATFLAETQRGFYERGVALLRELKYDGLVICSNWHTADPTLLDALERWTYTAGDVTDHHGYFEGKHYGTASHYATRNGDRFENRTALDDPGGTPLRVNQAGGHPAMISEIGWPHPNAYQPEMTLMGALAMGKQGIDAVTWFVNDSPTLNQPDLTPKFAIDSPAVFGTFPAAALLFRGEMIAEQDPVLIEPLASAALKQLSGSRSASAAVLDGLRAGDVPPDVRDTGVGSKKTPWTSAFLGPVRRVYDEPAQDFVEQELGDTLDMQTDDATWQFDVGRLMTWQQHVGFARPAALVVAKGDAATDSDWIRDTTADFVSFAAVPLDGGRTRYLLQLITRARPRGFATTTRGDDTFIQNIGTRPWQVRGHDTTVTLPFDPVGRLTLTALDANGNRTDRPVQRTNDGAAMVWPDETLYVLVELK